MRGVSLSVNPFQPDAAVAARRGAQDGDVIRDAARQVIRDGSIAASDVADLVSTWGLPCVEDLMCHLLSHAETYAQPRISGFTVGAVGLCEGSGDLILGGNLEFFGTSLQNTIHGEGFVAIRAFQRGQILSVLALGEAHPCGHCRQTLTEFSNGRDLVLIDPKGYRLLLSDLYPWPFDPAYLNQSGAQSGQLHGFVSEGVPPDVAAVLTNTPIHAPYSDAPAALVVQQAGRLIAGGSIENVAFNPSLTPLQTAMVALIAQGGHPDQITRAWLVQRQGCAVNYASTISAFLAAIAPNAQLECVTWAAGEPIVVHPASARRSHGKFE